MPRYSFQLGNLEYLHFYQTESFRKISNEEEMRILFLACMKINNMKCNKAKQETKFFTMLKFKAFNGSVRCLVQGLLSASLPTKKKSPLQVDNMLLESLCGCAGSVPRAIAGRGKPHFT